MARVEQGESPKIQVVLNNTVASHMEASLSIQESLQMSIHTFAGSSTHRLDSLLARSLALWTQLSRAESSRASQSLEREKTKTAKETGKSDNGCYMERR